MTNVSKAMEYATTFEREAMREKLDAALGDVNHMNLTELEAMVLHHAQQIKDIAKHLLELQQYMEFKRREWVGLTDEQIKECSYDADGHWLIDREKAMRNVERAHGIGLVHEWHERSKKENT